MKKNKHVSITVTRSRNGDNVITRIGGAAAVNAGAAKYRAGDVLNDTAVDALFEHYENVVVIAKQNNH